MPRLALLLALLAATAAQAQTDDLRRVVLFNGTVLVGTVDDETADPVVIRTADGVEQRVARDRIVEITPLLDGRFTRYDPARTRLFFSPTARSLGSGVKRFSAYYIFPSVAFGVSDRLDVSLGSTIPFVSNEGAAIGLNGNAKLTIVENEGFAAALGGTLTVPLSTEGSPPLALGTVYAVATIGSEVNAVTVGAYGLYVASFDDAVDSDVADGTALLLGFERQISDRFKLVSENYAFVAFPGDETEVAFGTLTGVRFFGDQLAADIAVALGAYEGNFSTVPVPYLGMSYTF